MAANRARTRKIRAKMTETGLKYTQAARLVDEEWEKARAEAETAESGDEGER